MSTSIHADSPAIREYVKTIPIFDQFPYLTVRFDGGMRQVLLLPTEIDEAEAFRLALVQVRANQLDTCLTLNAAAGFYFSIDPENPGDTNYSFTDEPPRGGILLHDGLVPAWELPDDNATRARQLVLKRWSEEQRSRGGYRTTSCPPPNSS
jgi:hypothetical protein